MLSSSSYILMNLSRRFGFRWPQVADDLLEDMGLEVMRSGGNWLTWPFHTVSIKELGKLKEERDARRSAIIA